MIEPITSRPRRLAAREFVETLKAERMRRRWSLRMVVNNAIGMTTPSLHRYESHIGNPDLLFAQRWAEALDFCFILDLQPQLGTPVSTERERLRDHECLERWIDRLEGKTFEGDEPPPAPKRQLSRQEAALERYRRLRKG